MPFLFRTSRWIFNWLAWQSMARSSDYLRDSIFFEILLASSIRRGIPSNIARGSSCRFLEWNRFETLALSGISNVINASAFRVIIIHEICHIFFYPISIDPLITKIALCCLEQIRKFWNNISLPFTFPQVFPKYQVLKSAS